MKILWFKILAFKVTFANTPLNQIDFDFSHDCSPCGLSKLVSVGCVVCLISLVAPPGVYSAGASVLGAGVPIPGLGTNVFL